MKIFFLRFFFILLLVFFEISFFDILFPQISVPVVLIVSIVAWTLVVGFPRVLFFVVPVVVFFDIVSSGRIETLTLYAVFLAYATSFLSRRLLVEHRGAGMFLYALFAALGSIAYRVFHSYSPIYSQSPWSGGIPKPFEAMISSDFFFLIMLSALLFPAIYWVIWRFETYTNLLAQRDILQIKY